MPVPNISCAWRTAGQVMPPAGVGAHVAHLALAALFVDSGEQFQAAAGCPGLAADVGASADP
ncbi:MAG TPA: hypothetical protein VHO07_14915 [Streptosporangiaceae bacterium]|nr:hypothetical protein [Streptosporangiaceae bacterium]